MEENDVSLVHVDRTQDEEAIVKAASLEEPLHFKTDTAAHVATFMYENIISRLVVRKF